MSLMAPFLPWKYRLGVIPVNPPELGWTRPNRSIYPADIPCHRMKPLALGLTMSLLIVPIALLGHAARCLVLCVTWIIPPYEQMGALARRTGYELLALLVTPSATALWLLFCTGWALWRPLPGCLCQLELLDYVKQQLLAPLNSPLSQD